MTREQIIEKVCKIARGWYWGAEVVKITMQDDHIITKFCFTPFGNYSQEFMAELTDDKPYTLINYMVSLIKGLEMIYHDPMKLGKGNNEELDNYIWELEQFTKFLEDTFYENYETGKDPSELIDVKYFNVEYK